MKYTIKTIKPRVKDGVPVEYMGSKGYFLGLTDDSGAFWDASALFKSEPAIGEELDGELEKKEYNGKIFYSFKKTKKEWSGQKETSQASFALSYAKDLVIGALAHDFVPEDANLAKLVIEDAELFLKWLKENQ